MVVLDSIPEPNPNFLATPRGVSDLPFRGVDGGV